MISRLVFSKEWRMKCIHFTCKSRQHNSYSIEDNHFKTSQTIQILPQLYLQKYKPDIKYTQITRV